MSLVFCWASSSFSVLVPFFANSSLALYSFNLSMCFSFLFPLHCSVCSAFYVFHSLWKISSWDCSQSWDDYLNIVRCFPFTCVTSRPSFALIVVCSSSALWLVMVFFFFSFTGGGYLPFFCVCFSSASFSDTSFLLYFTLFWLISVLSASNSTCSHPMSSSFSLKDICYIPGRKYIKVGLTVRYKGCGLPDVLFDLNWALTRSIFRLLLFCVH